MIQAAPSGVRNIEEGRAASAASGKTELKITNVARASPEELMRGRQALPKAWKTATGCRARL
jgi:hypothetical protein